MDVRATTTACPFSRGSFTRSHWVALLTRVESTDVCGISDKKRLFEVRSFLQSGWSPSSIALIRRRLEEKLILKWPNRGRQKTFFFRKLLEMKDEINTGWSKSWHFPFHGNCEQNKKKWSGTGNFIRTKTRFDKVRYKIKYKVVQKSTFLFRRNWERNLKK